jgi:hypothetical protein
MDKLTEELERLTKRDKEKNDKYTKEKDNQDKNAK